MQSILSKIKLAKHCCETGFEIEKTMVSQEGKTSGTNLD